MGGGGSRFRLRPLLFLFCLLRGKLRGLLGRLPLDGVAGKQEAVHLEIVGVLFGDGRGDLREQMLVGLDTAIQVFVQCFPAVKDFLLPGDFGLSVIPRRIGKKTPVQRPGIGDGFLRFAVIPGVLGNGIGHFIDSVASDTEKIALRLPLI